MSNYHHRPRASWKVEADRADYDDFLADLAADERAVKVDRRPAWVPDRIEGESDADYWARYATAEFRAMLDGTLNLGPSTYTARWGETQWVDPTGRRSWS